MKKYTLVILCGILILSAVILPEFTYKIHNTEITKSLGNKEYYQQGDILIKVYEFECEDGVGGITFDVGYDGDNLDFYDIITSGEYTVAYRDNHVGKLTLGVTDKNITEAADTNKSVKIAVGFKTLYMLDSGYISFSYKVKNFVDGNIGKRDNYDISESFYIYDDEVNNIEYEEYVRDIIGIDTGDTDTDINTETGSDTESDTEFDTDTGTGLDTESDTEFDTDTETSSDTESDTEFDTDTETGSDTESDTEFDTDKETDTETNTAAPEKYICGDVDNDGVITSADALYVLRNSVELEYFTPVQNRLGDVDGDGEITSADSLEILRYSVGLISRSAAGEIILI